MSNKFERYPSITNHYQDNFIFKITSQTPKNTKYVVTEKVHGANFQVTGTYSEDGIDIRVGSRSKWTTLEFFGIGDSNSFMEQYNKVIKYIFDTLYKHDGLKEISVFGEIYGGNIQKGIFYSGSKEFIVFDIKFTYLDGTTRFLPYRIMSYELEKRDIRFVKPLFFGTLEECLKYPNEYHSTLYKEHHPDKELEDNTCEGNVIKPDEEDLYLNDNSRVIIKSKNTKWSEKASIKKDPKAQEDYSDILEDYNFFDERINENRVNAAISKIGAEMKNIPSLLDEVFMDIYSEWENKDEKILRKLRKVLSKRVVSIIKKEIRDRA